MDKPHGFCYNNRRKHKGGKEQWLLKRKLREPQL